MDYFNINLCNFNIGLPFGDAVRLSYLDALTPGDIIEFPVDYRTKKRLLDSRPSAWVKHEFVAGAKPLPYITIPFGATDAFSQANPTKTPASALIAVSYLYLLEYLTFKTKKVSDYTFRGYGMDTRNRLRLTKELKGLGWLTTAPQTRLTLTGLKTVCYYGIEAKSLPKPRFSNKKPKDNTDFYLKINSAKTLTDFGNIPVKIAQFMHLWGTYQRQLRRLVYWTPANYGQLKHYLTSNGGYGHGRPINYYSITAFLKAKEYPNKSDILNWIDFDKGTIYRETGIASGPENHLTYEIGIKASVYKNLYTDKKGRFATANRAKAEAVNHPKVEARNDDIFASFG